MNDRALLFANPRLSRFNPLERILFHDDFDYGPQGWTEVIGNYEGSLDIMLPGYGDLRPPMLSNLSMWDTGSEGSLEGCYALKLATRPKVGAIALSVKRSTWRVRRKVQLEAYFCFKPEASKLFLSELDLRAVGVLFDIQDEELRWMPHLRYLNAFEGDRLEKWQFKYKREPLLPVGSTGKTRSHFHLAPTNWSDVPGGAQKLCYSEMATKAHWHYLRVKLDLASRTFVEFQCNDRTYSGEGMETMKMPAMPNLACMFNIALWVETDSDNRAFYYLDSVLVSGELD